MHLGPLASQPISALCASFPNKRAPLVIRKAANPRCFHIVDKTLLAVAYLANRKAWMMSILFSEWLERLNSKMKAQTCNILMFVDNCWAHPDVKLSNIKLVFLLPNTTSCLQPCDAGIIAMLKVHYWKCLVCHVLAGMDPATSATELSKRVDVMVGCGWLGAV